MWVDYRGSLSTVYNDQLPNTTLEGIRTEANTMLVPYWHHTSGNSQIMRTESLSPREVNRIEIPFPSGGTPVTYLNYEL